MRGENSSDWNNPNGFRLLSRDSLPSPGSNNSSLVMHGSDLYREVLYELQNEQHEDEDGDSSLSSDRDEDADGATRQSKPPSKSRRHSLDVDDLSPLVQCSNRYRRRDDARLQEGDIDDLKLPQPPYNNKPARSILRQLGPTIDTDDSLKARNRCRVTFKDSFDVIPSPRGRRASIAESNPSHRKQVNAGETSMAGRSEGDVDDENTFSESSGSSSASDRRRRHSLPHLTAIPNGVAPGEGQPENPGLSSLSLQDIEQDIDEGVRCEVVHSFTPRPRPRRCSYAGISGLESKYKEDSPVQQTPRPNNGSGTTRPSNGSGATRPVVPAANKAQTNKKISPSNNAGAMITRKNSAGKTSGKKDPPKVQSSKKTTPSSRRHSVV